MPPWAGLRWPVDCAEAEAAATCLRAQHIVLGNQDGALLPTLEVRD